MKLILLIPLMLSASSLPLGAVEVIRGPYLQLAGPERITIVWRTQGPLKDPEVRYVFGNTGEGPFVSNRESCRVRTVKSPSSPLKGAPTDVFQYEVTLSGLAPDTLYRYMIHDGETVLAVPDDLTLTFRTAPVPGTEKATRIWVVGDSGTGATHQALVHEAMRRNVEATGKALDLTLHVGDMAYSKGTDEQFQQNFFLPYETTLSHLVCWAAMGNHEGASSDGNKGVGPYFDAYVCPIEGEAGGLASGFESYYSFDHGNIHFIALNSHDIDRSPEGAMARWLKSDLQLTREKGKTRWLIAFWHHPPYSLGTHNSDKETPLVEMRQHIMPILEDYGVDLVLAGHSHIYERSMLLHGAYQTPSTAEGVILDDGTGDPRTDDSYRKSGGLVPANGTVSITTGHGGALGRKNIGVHPLMRSIVMDHGSTIIEIEGNTLNAFMLDLRGAERDRFAIVKEGVVAHQIVAKPWTPDETTPQRTGDGVEGSPKGPDITTNTPHPLPASTPLIPRHSSWYYLAGGAEPETTAWTDVGFDPDGEEEGWKTGESGFGYDDDDDRTVLNDMKGHYTTVYIRREFSIPEGTDLKKIGLAIDYDDGFVLHINGRRLLAQNVEIGEDGESDVHSHSAGKPEFFPLKEYAELFRYGVNVIALEGHNTKISSSDLTLDPWLVVED
jgi:acid phosphatase type 7